MVVLKNFKNGPLSTRQGATRFFCKKKFTNRSSVSAARGLGGGGSGGGRPPNGRRGLPPVTGSPPYKSPSPPLPSSFEPENSTKNPEKKERSEEKESGEALPDSALVICRLVHLV